MLVVTRYKGESVQIGLDVKVTIIQVGERRVALGIEAPHEIPIYRDEVIAQVLAEKLPVTLGEHFEVLLVEDTPVHAQLVERALRKKGVSRVNSVTTGEDALALLGLDGCTESQASPDLILLDLALPRMTGLQVLEKIRASDRHRTTPVVMLSCADSETDVARCLAAGANAFVAKSETADEFRQSIFRIIDFWGHACRA